MSTETNMPPGRVDSKRVVVKSPPRYTVGKEVVPFFQACGQMWEILFDGSRLFVFPGPKVEAQLLCGKLNKTLREAAQ